jgi:hypothetical protein
MAGCGCPTRRGSGGDYEAFPAWSPGAVWSPGRDGMPRWIPVLRTRSADWPTGSAVTGRTACPARLATVHTVTDQYSGKMPVTLA